MGEAIDDRTTLKRISHTKRLPLESIMPPLLRLTISDAAGRNILHIKTCDRSSPHQPSSMLTALVCSVMTTANPKLAATTADPITATISAAS